MRVIFCTTPVDKAEGIASALVQEQLVACVNIIPTIQSNKRKIIYSTYRR